MPFLQHCGVWRGCNENENRASERGHASFAELPVNRLKNQMKNSNPPKDQRANFRSAPCPKRFKRIAGVKVELHPRLFSAIPEELCASARSIPARLPLHGARFSGAPRCSAGFIANKLPPGCSGSCFVAWARPQTPVDGSCRPRASLQEGAGLSQLQVGQQRAPPRPQRGA